ncbi:MAG: protease precursor [Segetibacter sp.]|nr:protease precursor [Segetibacter sp.]
MHNKTFLIAAVLFICQALHAQDNIKGWHLLDASKDSLNGISLNNTYEFLKAKKSNPVIVAVIDSGIDTTHEDLKEVLWKNPKEIAGNGKDDDGNGYVDDIYGWNFLGGKDGRNVEKESSEAARVFHRYKQKFYRTKVVEDSLTAEEKEQYKLWKKASTILDADPEASAGLMFLEIAIKAARKHETVLKSEMNKDEFTAEEVEKFAASTSQARQAKMGYLTFLRLAEMEKEETNKSIFSDLEEYIEHKKRSLEAKDKAPATVREEIVKDNYFNINDRFYGNSDVMGPSSVHGTHVSGIIGANRNNKLGINGIAGNVKIMMLRAVPDGDEYDKDVALAIKYAVDNGAKVINMSFGKGISPEKKWVDEAVKYAETKDVLLVHAAGNDGENNDSTENFPNARLKDFNTIAPNYISVGASSDPKVNGKYVADFSNYGKSSVNVFAPGVKIFSTMPGGNKYAFQQGTSMAAPVVSGVAALIRSYYPKLSAKQVKYAIEKSAVRNDTLMVVKPGSKQKVTVSEISTSGGFLNAFNAIKIASTLEPAKKEPKKEVLPKSTFKNKIAKK